MGSSLGFVMEVQADSKPFYKYPLSSLTDTKAPSTQDSIQRWGSASSLSQYGSVFAKGDMNNDGIDDLMIASPYYSMDMRKNCGRVEVYFGTKDFFASMATTKPERKPDIDILGPQPGSQLGTALITGDVNHDSYSDIIMGSPGNSTVYVMYGTGTYKQPLTYDLSRNSADWTLRAKESEERFGFSLDSADINGDGIDDILVSAPFASKEGVKRVGKVYGVYGKSRIPQYYDQYLAFASPDLLLWGTSEDDRFGITLAHGDIDGDTKIDLAIGSYMATNGVSKQAGTVTILQGSKLTIKKPVRFDEENVDEADDNEDNSQETLLTADRSFDWFGYALSFGDLNSDGVDDLVMSAFPYLKNNKQGQVYILWGEKNGSFEGKKLSRVVAPDETALIGSSVGISDINHDGALDLLIGGATGAPGSDRNFGRFYALNFFPRNKEMWNFSKNPADLTIEGRSANDWFGNSFIVGDFDNDGHRDMVIGAPNSRKNGITSGSIELIRGPIMSHGDVSYTLPSPSDYLNRGSFMVQITKALALDQKNKEFLDSCLADVEFCFYQFTSQTKFAGLRLTPLLRLYPDVKPSDPYYKAVNIATMLGIIRGFSDEPNSPFHPEKPISRIQGLKILLTSTGMLPWKEYFELRNELVKNLVVDSRSIVSRDTRDKDPIPSQKTPYKDISARIPHMWWYPRYVNFAYLSGIIDDSVFFQPDAPLTQKDFEQWMGQIKEYLSRHQ